MAAVGDLRQVEVGFVSQMGAGSDGRQVQSSREVNIYVILIYSLAYYIILGR